MLAVIEHFNNYIPQLGYISQSWRPKSVILNEQNPSIFIAAQNEYWYLIPQSIIEGLELFADNDYVRTDAVTTAEPRLLIKPLTGNIHITIPPNTRQVLNFIQVIPRT